METIPAKYGDRRDQRWALDDIWVSLKGNGHSTLLKKREKIALVINGNASY